MNPSFLWTLRLLSPVIPGSSTSSKKRSSPDQPVQPASSTSSKRQKQETPLSLSQGTLESRAAKICDSISSTLKGDRWKDQTIGDLGCITQRSTTFLAPVERAVNASLAHPSASIESRNGLFPAALCNALLKANAGRKWETKQRTNNASQRQNLNSLTGTEFKVAISLLRNESEYRSTFI